MMTATQKRERIDDDNLSFIDSLRDCIKHGDGTRTLTDRPRNLTNDQRNALKFCERIMEAIDASPQSDKLDHGRCTVHAMAGYIYRGQQEPSLVLDLCKGDAKNAPIPAGFLDPKRHEQIKAGNTTEGKRAADQARNVATRADRIAILRDDILPAMPLAQLGEVQYLPFHDPEVSGISLEDQKQTRALVSAEYDKRLNAYQAMEDRRTARRAAEPAKPPMSLDAAKAQASAEWGNLDDATRSQWSETGFIGYRSAVLSGRYRSVKSTAIAPTPITPASAVPESAEAVATAEWERMSEQDRHRWIGKSYYVSARVRQFQQDPHRQRASQNSLTRNIANSN
jgi:hypothetical protein